VTPRIGCIDVVVVEGGDETTLVGIDHGTNITIDLQHDRTDR
jgi:hypothetical protein